jgi:hypothetical protein
LIEKLKTYRQSYNIIALSWSLTEFKSYPCPYFDPMVPIDDQPPIWSISSIGHPEALRRSLKVCRKLWAVSPKSFFNHLPSALDACVARQVPSFRYRGYRQWSSACCKASIIDCLAHPTIGKVLRLLAVFSRRILLERIYVTSSAVSISSSSNPTISAKLQPVSPSSGISRMSAHQIIHAAKLEGTTQWRKLHVHMTSNWTFRSTTGPLQRLRTLV